MRSPEMSTCVAKKNSGVPPTSGIGATNRRFQKVEPSLRALSRSTVMDALRPSPSRSVAIASALVSRVCRKRQFRSSTSSLA